MVTGEISARTSCVRASHAALSAASTLRRRSGSVLEGRRLNHQSPKSTVKPVQAVLARLLVVTRDRLDDPGRIVDGGVDLARIGVALEVPSQVGQRAVACGQHFEDHQCGDGARIGPVVVPEVVMARVLASEDARPSRPSPL